MTDSLMIDDRYQLGMELGAGAFGSVYKARQIVMGLEMRDVALKLFRADVIDVSNVAQQMNDALAINAVLSNLTDWEIRQHFLTVYDMGVTREDQPRAYVAMELVREGSLAKRIRSFGNFSLQGTLHYLVQIARALAFMHSNRFVHSDLKPDNILLFRHRGQDHVKLGDFGLAGKCRGLLDAQGPRGGDMAYMAPEVLQGLNTIPASDVFSLGVMCYEMVTGKNPYAHVGETLSSSELEDHEKMKALRIQSREEPLRLYPARFPELNAGPQGGRLFPILQIINRMLEPRPDKRYHSAVEVASDIENQLGSVLEVRSSTPENPAKAEAGQTEPQGDPRRDKLEQQWESAIRGLNWADAEKIARALIAIDPVAPDGHLLLGETPLRQADALTEAGGRTDVVVAMRRKSIRWLNEGLAVVAPDKQSRLRQRMAHVYRLLNDEQTANLILSSPR